VSASLDYEPSVNKPTNQHPIASSASTMLVELQEENRTCKIKLVLIV